MLDGRWLERRSGQKENRTNDTRDQYERDRSRIIHSAAFRRLQGKTQVLGIGESDFLRTRLTHSMEAAQISRGLLYVAGALKTVPKGFSKEEHLPKEHLLEMLCLAHDLGHPPFGHSGERALNFAMKKHGGFEGNGQTLRLVALLEAHTPEYGLDPTRRTLLGLLKYPMLYSEVVRRELAEVPADRHAIRWDEWKPPKCIHNEEEHILDWILSEFTSKDRDTFRRGMYLTPTKHEHGKPRYSSLDASLMTLADDIAYGVHDLEDSVALGLVSKDNFDKAVEIPKDDGWVKTYGLGESSDELFSGNSDMRKRAIGRLVNAFAHGLEVREREEFEHPLLRFHVELAEVPRKMLAQLSVLNFDKVVGSQAVQTLEYRGNYVVLGLFEAISSNPRRLLSDGFRRQLGKHEQHRVVCDYVSGMTDEYATRIYERLFVPRRGSAFDPL
jgi:dGTPase